MAAEKTVAEKTITTEEILARLTALEIENKMLKELAGKSAVADYIEKQKDTSVKSAYFKVYNGKPIVEWRCTKNFVANINGVWQEEIEMEIKTIDGKLSKIELIDFANIQERVIGFILPESNFAYNGIVKLQMPTGEIIETRSQFLNA